jgi:hypothetical protein
VTAGIQRHFAQSPTKGSLRESKINREGAKELMAQTKSKSKAKKPATPRKPGAKRSRSWRCSSCDMSVSFEAGKAPKRPDGWSKRGGKWLCLRCRREEVMDKAGQGPEGWASRRHALIEFELLRDREATEMEIAKRASCSTAVVRKVRAALRESGKLPESAASRS